MDKNKVTVMAAMPPPISHPLFKGGVRSKFFSYFPTYFQCVVCKRLECFEHMGSLMAGWDSPVRDPKAVTYQRNRSFTKGEIDAYWRARKKIEEEHLKAISCSSDRSQESIIKEESAESKVLERSSSLPLVDTKRGFLENFTQTETETSLEKFLLKNGWWTRSNWAHLNEPPVIGPEGASHKYASQFHVAGLSSSSASDRAGLTT